MSVGSLDRLGKPMEFAWNGPGMGPNHLPAAGALPVASKVNDTGGDPG